MLSLPQKIDFKCNVAESGVNEFLWTAT